MNYNTFINKDIRNRPQTKRHNGLRWLVFAAGSAVLGVVIASTSGTEDKAITKVELPDSVNTTIEKDLQSAIANANTDLDQSSSEIIKLELPKPEIAQLISSIDTDESENTAQFAGQHDWQDLKVKSGDSLSSLFDKAKIKPDQLVELMRLGSETSALKQIHPGDTIQVEADNDGQLLALNFPIDDIRYLRVIRDDNGLVARTLQHDIETRSAYASGEIDSSLFLASQKAGLSQNLTMELANVFGWDIDFVLDIRKGDRFTLIYEEIFKNGEKLKDGNILAAEFINQGRSHRAVRYVNPTTGKTGYYSPDGHSLRKAFLRSPVKFSRISSGFTTKRYHPLLHKFRSHKGVDYAASRGTPVRASGDGKVIYRGKKGGYGNVIILKHGNRYSTLYAHLSKFNRKVRSGSRVKQGQVIGYVGSTGLASGPHLHYEFRVNGVHRNPLRVKFPSTKPIPERHKDNFELTTHGYVAQLDVLSRNALALNEN